MAYAERDFLISQIYLRFDNKMKSLIKGLFLLSVFLFSCKAKKQQYVKSEYDPIAGISVAMDEEEKKYWDSLCVAESENALKDIRNNQLTYTHVFGMVEMHNSNAEMDSLLNTYSIKTREAPYYCMAPASKQNCYAREMNIEIAKRFGNSFIESLRKKAEIMYVNNNKNRVFPFEECDRNSRYFKTNDYSISLDLVKEDFWNETDYPEDFIYRKEKDFYSSMEANFILYKDGSISEPDVDITFQNDNNYQFSGYFMDKIKKFVKKSKWKSATHVGIPVNSEMNVLIFFK